MKQKIVKQATYWLGVVAIGLVLGLSIQFAVAWKEPIATPPGGNLKAPLNVSDNFQYKGAGLMLNTSGISKDGLIVANGNVGIGTNNPDDRFRMDVDGGLIVYDSIVEPGYGFLDVTGDGVGAPRDAYSIINLDSFSRTRGHQAGTWGITFEKTTGNFTITHSDTSGTIPLSITKYGNIKASGTICDKNGCIGDSEEKSIKVHYEESKFRVRGGRNWDSGSATCPAGTVIVGCGYRNASTPEALITWSNLDGTSRSDGIFWEGWGDIRGNTCNIYFQTNDAASRGIYKAVAICLSL